MPPFGYPPVGSRSASGEIPDSNTRLRVLFVLAALPVVIAAFAFPKAVALPAASLIALTLAAGVAFYAYRSGTHYRSRGLTFWDLAGMLAFIGFGAGAVSDPFAALELFGVDATR